MLLDARHIRRQDISDPAVLTGIAAEAGADIDRFLLDFKNPTVLEALARDHLHAVNVLKIFGTPTFVFHGNTQVFLKISTPDLGDNHGFFREFRRIAETRPGVLEIKRP